MKYPFVIEPARLNLAASAVQFATLATANNRAELGRLMAEQLALELHSYAERNETPPAPLDDVDIDLSNYEAGSMVVYVEPAPLNPVSLTLAAELEQLGVKPSELAKRLGTSRSVVSRLTNPFYWGHSVKTLNRVAEVLGTELRVSFAAPEAAPKPERRATTRA